MAVMDTRIPLMGQAPNILGSYVQGIGAADSVNTIRREQAKQDFLKQYGTDLYNGDANAMAAYAQFDPQGAMAFRSAAEARARANARRAGPARTSPENSAALNALLGVREPDPVSPDVSAPIAQPVTNGGDMPTLPDAAYSAPETPVPTNENSEAWNRGGAQAGPSNLQSIVAAQGAEDVAISPAAPITPEAAPIQFDPMERKANQLAAIASDPSYSREDRARAKAALSGLQEQAAAEQEANAVKARSVIQGLDVAYSQGPEAFNEALRLPGFAEAAQQFGVDYNTWPVKSAQVREVLGMDQAATTTQKPTAAELKIQRLMETGLDRETAIAIADGRIAVSKDPVTGEVVLVDKASTPMLGNLGAVSDIPDTTQQATIDQNVDYAKAFGVVAAATDFGNRALDSVGLGQLDPEADTAIQNLSNLAANTMLIMQDAVPGRPSDKVLAMLEKFTVDPAKVTNGPEGALSRTIATRKMIEEAIDQQRAIAEGNFSIADRSNARMKLMPLETLAANYRTLEWSLKGAMDSPEYGAQAEADIPESFMNNPSVQKAIEEGISAQDIWNAYGGDKSQWQ